MSNLPDVEDLDDNGIQEQMIAKPKQIVNDSLFDDLKSMHKHCDKEEKADESDLKFSAEIKKKTLMSILVTLGIGNMQVGNLMTVMPIFVGKQATWDTNDEGLSSQPSAN